MIHKSPYHMTLRNTGFEKVSLKELRINQHMDPRGNLV